MPTPRQKKLLLWQTRRDITYLLRDEFSSGDLTSPRTCVPGPGTLDITDTAPILSIVDGVVTPSAQITGNRDPWIRDTDPWTRTAGRTFILRVKRSDSLGANSDNPVIGWATINTTPNVTHVNGLTWSVAGVEAFGSNLSSFPRLLDHLANDTWYVLAFTQLAAGMLIFVDGKLAWLYQNDTTTPLYPSIFSRAAGNRPWFLDNFKFRDLPAPYTTYTGIATLAVGSPSGAYTGTANQITEITLTAPAVIATECGLKYRVTDANNYWWMGFDITGAFEVRTYSGGTPTDRISVAGVIAGGQTRTIRVYADGTAQRFQTVSGNTYAERGSELAISHQDTSTGLETDIGTGWTAANLNSWPRSVFSDFLL